MLHKLISMFNVIPNILEFIFLELNKIVFCLPGGTNVKKKKRKKMKEEHLLLDRTTNYKTAVI